MDNLNDPTQSTESIEPKRQPVNRWRIFWLVLIIAGPIAVVLAIVLTYSFASLGWNVSGSLVGLLCGISVSRIVQLILERRARKRAEEDR